MSSGMLLKLKKVKKEMETMYKNLLMTIFVEGVDKD